MVTIDIRKANKVNGDWGLFVKFPYNEALVSAIRSLPSRYWHADNKEWEVPFNKLSYLVDAFKKYAVTIGGNLSALNERKLPIVDYTFKTQPFDHQMDGFNYGMTHDKWLLGDEQGLGKTKQTIDIALAKRAERGYKHCLIICGVNGLKWNWQNEIATHSDEVGYILGQREVKGRLKIGSNADKLEDIKNIDNLPYFIITNVESLRNEDIAMGLKKWCDNGVIGMIAIDEIHKCKNAMSQQGKGILKLKADTMIAMTGTPLMNTPLDLYIIFKWLGYEKHAFYSFRNHYCTMGGFGGYEIVGYRNMDELEERLNELMLRRLKEDVFDLPEKTFVNEYVELTGKQAQVYKEILMDLRAHVDQIVTSPNPLAQLIRLRQATGYTGILSSDIKESAKLDRAEELIADARANGKKVVVFSNWTQITDAFYERLRDKGYGVATITGETPDDRRQSVVDLFQNSGDCNVLIGTVGAMGTGLTLTAGTVVIFLDEPWTMAMKNQAIDRCHRIGTTQNITVYTLLTKDTIDERVNDIVANKGIMADAIIDGKIVGDKKQLVDFLLT